jgi:hypothetical protein
MESRVKEREGGPLSPIDPMFPARYGVPPRPFPGLHRLGYVVVGKDFLFGPSLGDGLNPSHNGLPAVVNIDPLDPNYLVWTATETVQDLDLVRGCPE